MNTPSARDLTVQMEGLEGRLYLAAVEPTAFDQYMLELINQARANPVGQAAFYGVDLNEGLPAGTITTDPKPPLAFNPNLVDSARSHTQWMLANGLLQSLETPTNSFTVSQRMLNAGYPGTDPWGVGENIAAYTFVQTDTGGIPLACEKILKGLFVDSGMAGRVDRLNMLDARFHEIGIGSSEGLFNGSDAVLATQDYAFQAGNPFLTGVVFDDALVRKDSFYTPGEGLGNVTVTAVKHGGGTFIAQTYSSGGYSLQLAPGTYDVTFTGMYLASSYVINNVVIANDNVKLDLRRDRPPAQSDLIVLAARGAALKLFALAGGAVDFAASIRNTGSAAVNKTFTNTLFLSADSTVTAADTDVADFTLPSLKANTTSSRTITFTAPAMAGTYYLSLMADSGNTISEAKEDNNFGSVIQLVVGTPDVAVTVTACSLPLVIVPGDKGTLTLQLANSGTIPASETATFHVYASADDTVGPGDVELYHADRAINLAPAGHTTLSLPFTVTDAMAAGAWKFIAQVDPLAGETVTDNNSAAAADSRQLVWQFGTFAGRRNVALKVHDANGTPVTFSLGGDGWGEVVGGAALTTIQVNASNARTSLSVVIPARANHALAGGLTVAGDIRSVSAGTTDFAGTVQIDGGATTLTLGNVTGGAIELHHNNALTVDPKLQTALTVGVVQDTTLDAANIPLRSLTATSWVNSDPLDLLSAPSLGSLTVKGVPGKNLIPGNFTATLRVAGNIGPASIAANLGGEIDANAVKSLRVRGDMDTMVLKLGQDPDAKLTALGSLTVTGWLRNSQVAADGNIGAVSVGGLDTSLIYAGVAAAVVGLPSLPTDLPLHATVRSVTVTGRVKQNLFSVINSNIAAWTLSSVSLVYARSANIPSSPWGLACHTLTRYSYRDTAIRYTWPNRSGEAKPTVPGNDFTVNLI